MNGLKSVVQSYQRFLDIHGLSLVNPSSPLSPPDFVTWYNTLLDSGYIDGSGVFKPYAFLNPLQEPPPHSSLTAAMMYAVGIDGGLIVLEPPYTAASHLLAIRNDDPGSGGIELVIYNVTRRSIGTPGIISDNSPTPNNVREIITRRAPPPAIVEAIFVGNGAFARQLGIPAEKQSMAHQDVTGRRIEDVITHGDFRVPRALIRPIGWDNNFTIHQTIIGLVVYQVLSLQALQEEYRSQVGEVTFQVD